MRRKPPGEVSAQWKNPDFPLRNPDFLLKNVDFRITQERGWLWIWRHIATYLSSWGVACFLSGATFDWPSLFVPLWLFRRCFGTVLGLIWVYFTHREVPCEMDRCQGRAAALHRLLNEHERRRVFPPWIVPEKLASQWAVWSHVGLLTPGMPVLYIHASAW